MSVTDQLQHLHDLSRRFIHHLVDTPVMELFGRTRHRSQNPAGQPPGTLFIEPDAAPTRVQAWHIDGELLDHRDDPSLEDIRALHGRGGRIWVDIAGLADDQRIRAIGELFGLHPVVLADLVNIERQTKASTMDRQALVIIQALHLAAGREEPGMGQIGLLLGENWLLTFRERPDPVTEPVVARLQRPTSRLRTEPLDYLACALLDVAIDASFPVVEALADRIDETETEVMAGKGHGRLGELHGQRRALIALGRIFWRQRDLMARLLRDEEIFRRETHIFLRGVYDCTVQQLDMVETTRDLAASLVEIHLSISANRTNQIMKTLTIMASIFIPLTFIAGVYGMNFEWMPELTWTWGYPAVLGLMLAVSLGLLLWFRKRGWLGGD